MDAPGSLPPPARRRLLGVVLLSLPVLGLSLPFLGLLLSLVLSLVLVPRAGLLLWEPLPARLRSLALLGWGLLWLPAVLAFSGVSSLLTGPEGAGPLVGSTAWLFVPLCAPAAPLVPTLAASGVFVLGASLSARSARPLPWLLGALLAPLSYDLVMALLSVEFSC